MTFFSRPLPAVPFRFSPSNSFGSDCQNFHIFYLHVVFQKSCGTSLAFTFTVLDTGQSLFLLLLGLSERHVSELQLYTSNLYCSTPPISNAAPCWLLNFWRKGNAAIHPQFVPQYASCLYRSMPPICTGDTSNLRKYQGLGVPESS